jgi:PERQ amino acid-rich with GYF domain-containing protein
MVPQPLVLYVKGLARSSNEKTALVSIVHRLRLVVADRSHDVDQPSVTIPRRSSLSSGPVSMTSPRDSGQPSPRIRGPFTPGFDGVLNGGDSWAGRRRLAEGLQKSGGKEDAGGGDGQQLGRDFEIKEEEEETETETDLDQGHAVPDGSESDNPPAAPAPEPSRSPPSTDASNLPSGVQVVDEGIRSLSLTVETPTGTPGTTGISLSQDLADVEWSYLDPQGKLQGKSGTMRRSREQLTVDGRSIPC